MPAPEPIRIGYVVKRYPRYSETFVVNEILAQEAAGVAIDLFSLRAPEDTHFQDTLARVRAPLTYLPDRAQKASDLWDIIRFSARICPDLWTHLPEAAGTEARELAHACALAAHVVERGLPRLHAHFASSAASVARLAARFAGVPYSLTAHAKDIFHAEVDQAELHAKLRDASAVITISDYNAADLAARFPDCRDRIHRVYNGLDVTRFAFTPPETREPLILFVGRLVEKKGLTHLIDACERLARAGRAFRCLIVGGGELEPVLRARIVALGLADRVTLAGPRPQGELMDLIRSAALLAAPCVVGADGNRDGIPTVLLEAMALGTPCVSTPVTGIPEVVRYGETGLLAREADAESLAESIAALLDDAALRVRLAQRARALIESEFDIHRNTAALRALILAAEGAS
jgi:glycosyltransferase involved in cell wall biosynthesis